MPLKLPMWQGGVKRRQRMVAPERDPKPYEVPGPEFGAPYIPANYDFSPGRLAPQGYGQYEDPLQQEQDPEWRDRGVSSAGSRPSAARPAQQWRGYKQDNWVRSQRDEHVENAREGEPIKQSRWHPALNPYFYRIPDSRQPRAPHEYSFTRPYDQLWARTFSGEHYSEADTVTDTIGGSLKGMNAPKHRISTFRLEPTQWGENTVSVADRSGPAAAVYTSPTYSFYSPSNRLG